MVGMFHENILYECRVGDPQVGLPAVEVAQHLAVFLHQFRVVLGYVLEKRNISIRKV